ncbi:MAG: hypothetical protein PUC65_02340, partial [Clostridiales bacterium]|nr:hypothetical protein [Clostridiales bacterium]
IQASTSVQEEKVVSIENVNSNIEQFVEDTNAIDGKVVDLVDKRKDDFYEQYNYLKPECEKSNWEKFCDDLEDIGEWCKEHWKEILKVVAIIVIAIVVVATGDSQHYYHY